MEEIALPDGRRAQLWTGGATSAPAVLVCHGTPDTRWVARTGRAAAAAATTGRWWVDRIAGAEVHVTPTTHLATLLANWNPILATLSENEPRQPHLSTAPPT